MSVGTLCGIVMLFGVRLKVLVESVQRFFPSVPTGGKKSRRAASPLLARGRHGGGPTLSSRLKELENQMREELTRRGREDLL